MSSSDFLKIPSSIPQDILSGSPPAVLQELLFGVSPRFFFSNIGVPSALFSVILLKVRHRILTELYSVIFPGNHSRVPPDMFCVKSGKGTFSLMNPQSFPSWNA